VIYLVGRILITPAIVIYTEPGNTSVETTTEMVKEIFGYFFGKKKKDTLKRGN